jgi:hypothetical protein
MEIFSEEFKAELSSQLEALTIIVKKDEPKPMSDYEIAKLNQDCFDNLDCGKKEKKIIFKAYDTVYFGNLKGIVLRQKNDNTDMSLRVDFKNNERISFTKDGRFFQNFPIVLSHFPYELKMKKIKE